MPEPNPRPRPEPPPRPFRRVVLRGLGVLLPPLLTVVIFIWVGNTIVEYLLEPLEGAARWGIAKLNQDQIKEGLQVDPETGLAEYQGREYRQTEDGKFVPKDVYDRVDVSRDDKPMPRSAKAVYRAYVDDKILKRRYVVPIFLCAFVLILYLLGDFLAAGVGKFFWVRFEQGIHQLPLVRNVYSSVKQVTDFLFSESEVEYTRVVAIEYPRKGIWSLAMVTGESMLDIRSAANEPVLSVLVPTSPMPFTGFTVTVRKSETVDLNITIDQAFQFIVSCGVVVPSQQLQAIRAPETNAAAEGGARDSRIDSALPNARNPN